MKKFNFRKTVSTLMAASVAAGSLSAINAMAVSPEIYVDIVYEDSTTIRADVMFENMPALYAGGFHVEIGEGFDFVLTSSGNVKQRRTDRTIVDCDAVATRLQEPGDTFFVAFAHEENIDLNGNLISFYITKSDTYTSTNATVNISFENGDYLTYRQYIDGGVEFTDVIEDSSVPTMLKSEEYIIGDADGNHIITPTDSAVVLSATNNSILTVYDIRNTYTNIFPNADSAAAPDATRDGLISSADADAILDGYSEMQTNLSYDGIIGKIDVYEVF